MTPAIIYEVIITSHAYRSLKKLRKNQQLLNRLDTAIQLLASQPRPAGCRKLNAAQYDNIYRIRVADWRILYAIEDDKIVVLILDVVARDHAYRNP